jgi:hypothetical protein
MKLSEIIEFEVTCVLLELRTKFNLQHFQQLQDINQKADYARQTLKLLGEGSSRIAFALSNRYVLKVANPNAVEGGMAQNKSEVSVFTNPKVKPVVSAIYNADQNYHWIITEIVRPMSSPEEFEQLSGVSWNNFSDVVKRHSEIEQIVQDEISETQPVLTRLQKRLTAPNIPEETKKTINAKIKKLTARITGYQNLLKNPIVQGALNLIREANVMPGDIEEWDHWGKTADGRLVLYDYGFTRDLVHLYKKNA